MKEVTMWSNIANEWNAFVNLGEKETQSNEDNHNSNINTNDGDSNGLHNEQTTEVMNGRMDTNGRIHDNLGQFMSKAGFTGKPSLTTAIEEAITTIETERTEGGETSESAIIE